MDTRDALRISSDAPSSARRTHLIGPENSLRQLFDTYGPWFLGLCCGNVWIGWMNGERGLEPSYLWDTLCAATMIVTLIIALLYGRRHADRVRLSYPADWPIAITMALFTLPATGLVEGEPAIVHALSTIATEVGMAWLYIRWGVFLSRLDIRSTVGCILAAHVVGCTAKLCLYYILPWVAVPFISLLPLASIALLGLASRHLPPAACQSQSTRRPPAQPDAGPASSADIPATMWCTNLGTASGPLWKVAAFVACYRVFFYAIRIVGDNVSDSASLSLSTICCLAEITVALIIIYMLFFKSGSFTFQQVWSIFLLLLGIVLLCAIAPVANVIGNHVRAAAGSLLVMFTWLVFADISHHSTLHPFVIFGIARISYEAPRLLIEGLSLFGITPPFDNAFYIGVLFFALLVFAILFFDWRDPTLSLIFSDFQKRPDSGSPDRLEEVCRQAAADHGLTQREEEVLLYLCQGRTRAYIAETLYLSENTVRGHTQRIYGKLEVHNKTELQRKLGV